MKVGHVIRAERVRQEMKQIVLAKGICTPSYLSKIERNLIAPSEEVATLLLNRLGVDPDKLQKNDLATENEFKKMLLDSYKEVITTRDDDFTKQRLDYLEKNAPLFENHSLHYTYLLITLRFRITLGKELDERKKEIQILDGFSGNFDAFQKYLLNLIKALYYYTTANLKKAIENLEGALSIADDIILDNWEKAELYYMLGAIYTADGRIYHSIEYIRRALDFFRENFLMKRVLDCYVLIGITRKKGEQFQDALDAYVKAQQICDEFNLFNEKGIIYHNLGTLYGIMGNSQKAIHYYKESIENKSDENSKLISIFCLIIEYSKMESKNLVIEWCDKGISLFLQLNDENLTSYYHHFNFYKSLHSEQGLSLEVAEQVIEHFKTLQDYRHVHKYCIVLAEWYYNNRKYKLSSIYFMEANRYGYIYRKVEKWEDL